MQAEYPWIVCDEMEKVWRNPNRWGHRVFVSGKGDKHEKGVGFLVHKDIVKSVIGCRSRS